MMSDLTRRVFRRLYSSTFRKCVGTSISDNLAYPRVCTRAGTDWDAFSRFRRHPIYNQILEHVTPAEGSQYLEHVRKDPDVYVRLGEFLNNDRYGGPRVHRYAEIGLASPTTLRYVKVLTDLKRLFGSLDGASICEIGAGYGGQCRVIDAYFHPSKYLLVDIRPALLLAQRFLDYFVMRAVLEFRTLNELDDFQGDLAISNYAFTELNRELQDAYMRKIILRSPRGYITYNDITPEHFNSYKLEELLRLIPGAYTLPESPMTHPRNCLIVWGSC